MTNDTTTLNGALQELGETMASNLVTMGVTDAQASDGLTTLANRILDVPVTPVTQSLVLTSDKSILSYLDSDTATLTATLTGGVVSGQTIEFFNGSTSLGTATTNSNGIATKTYSSSGIGDMSLTATKGSLTSQQVTVEDCWYYNDGTNTTSLECPTGVSVTSNDGHLVIPNTSSEKIITVPKSLANSDNWEYSVKIARKDGNKVIGLTFNDSTYYLSSNNNTGKYYCHFSSDEYWSTDSAANDVITVRRQNGITKILINAVEQTSKTVSHKSSFKVGFYTISSTYQYVDDIILKPL